MRDRILNSYARWITRHPVGIAVVAFFVSVVALTISIFFLKTQTGILDLYDEQEPVAKRFIQYIDKFGAAETLIVVFEGGSEADRRKAMETLASRLKKDPQKYIEDILYKIDLQIFTGRGCQGAA